MGLDDGRQSDMVAKLKHSIKEIKRLQRCVNDLVTILALPSVWSGGDPSQIVRTSLEALLSMLRLDLVYVRLEDPVCEAPIEMARFAQSLKLKDQPKEIGDLLNDRLGPDPQKWTPLVRHLIANEDISLVPLRLGAQGEIGVIVAGSRRADFPGQIEKLLLSVAANQAAIGVQEARLLDEQKRVASVLDQRVAQRTVEVIAANEELRKEVAERKRSAEDLRRSEAFLAESEARLAEAQRELQITIDTIPAMVTTFKPDGTRDFVNQTWRDYFGTTLEEAKSEGRSSHFCAHPDDAEAVENAWRASLASGRPFLMELRVCGSDGLYRWHIDKRLPLHDENGHVAKWYGVIFDIEERKTAENALRRSEARKAAMLDSALDCIVTIDHEGRITEFNPAAERTFGYRRDEVVGKDLAGIIIPPSLRERHRRGVARYLATGETRVLGRRVEMTAVRADRSEIACELAITRIPTDGPPSFTGYLRDITERRQAEEKLLRSQAFLAKAQRLSLTGSFSFHREMEEFTWSEELYRIFEFQPGIRVTLPLIGSRYHPEDRHVMEETAGGIRSGATEFDYEHRLLMPDGSIKWIHVVAQASSWDKDGRGLEYFGAVQDVTQRKLSEQALHAAQTALAHASRVATLGEISATIAHEINQPLAAIRTNGETGLRWLDRAEPNVAKARDLMQRMVGDARRASEIIGRIRAMAAPRAPERSLLSLDDVVKESMVFLRHEFQSKSIAVSLDLAPALPSVAGDFTQLQQVVVNLAVNSVQAMVQSDVGRRGIFIRTMLSGPEAVCCTVEDSGPGIDPVHLARLFDSFFTTKDAGMGMGLAISRSIIEAHEGDIRADNGSALGGARFSFTLPASADSDSRQPAP